MNTTDQARSVSTSFVRRMAPVVSPQTRQLLTLGRERGWNCAVLGQAPLPDEPVRLGDWLIVPVHEDSSLVPARALNRVQAIFTAGLRPKGFVMAHEAPKLLPAPAAQAQYDTLQMPAIPAQLKSALRVISTLLGALAALAIVTAGLVVLAAVLMSFAAILVVLTALMAAVVVIDPILVAVTDDDYWIEIDRWWS